MIYHADISLAGFSCDSFPVDSHGTREPRETVLQYFQKRYGVSIQYKSLNCLQVGTPQRPKFLPLEVGILNNYSMDVSYCVNISSYIRNSVECGYTFILSQTCFLSLQCLRSVRSPRGSVTRNSLIRENRWRIFLK
jgi:hypothetical protein